MEEKLDTRLEKVEPNRRDFMKKVAIGAAYAVPVMASFSLDSVRNKAFAQASYGPTPPRVARLNVVDGSPDNFVVRITFDQAMDTSIAPNNGADSRIAKPAIECYDREWCYAFDNDPSHDTCESTDFRFALPPYTWRWDSNRVHILTISGLFSSGSTDNGSGPGIRIKYGKKPKEEGCIDFKGANGLNLVPFEGRVNLPLE